MALVTCWIYLLARTESPNSPGFNSPIFYKKIFLLISINESRLTIFISGDGVSIRVEQNKCPAKVVLEGILY